MQRFDTTIAQDLLADSEIKCADFLASIPVMTAFYEENKRNPELSCKNRVTFYLHL